MNNNSMTAAGRLTRDAEVRFTAAGIAVASFSIAWNERIKKGDVWEDGPANFLDVSAWRGLAESCAELLKGKRVIVAGVMKQREFEKDGQTRRVWEMTADEVGVCLDKFAPKADGGQRPQSQSRSSAGSDPWASMQSDSAPF